MSPASLPLSERVPPMFLPPDLTTSERALVDSLTKQLLDHRRPSTPAQEKAVRHEAVQVAAEMIFEARAASLAQSPGHDGDEQDEEPESGYHDRISRTLRRGREISQLEAAEMDGLEEPDSNR
jgi:hypothetical protein